MTGLLHDLLSFICTGLLGKLQCSRILTWAARQPYRMYIPALTERAVRLLRRMQCLLISALYLPSMQVHRGLVEAFARGVEL